MIYTVGETVLDVIINTFDNVKIKVGGSMLNTAVSLGRLGLPIEHISYLSEDQVAMRVRLFMKENNVGSKFILGVNDIKTNLALAFLDENKNADYVFYKNTDLSHIEFSFPDIKPGDIVLFGSFFSLNPDFREQLLQFLKEAKKKGAFLIYDPNYRRPHLSQLNELLPLIHENLRLADFVKASDEDLNLIFGVEDSIEAWKKMNEYDVKYMVYTKGAKGAEFISHNHELFVQSESISPLSTIGAGDTFTAGIIKALYLKEQVLTSEKEIVGMLKNAHQFSAHVCQSLDNYLSKEFAKNY